MKELVINMIPQITDLQRPNILYPSPQDTINTQPLNYLYQGVLLTNPYLPRMTPQFLPIHMLPPSPYPNIPLVYIPLQSTQGVTLPTTQTLQPSLPPSQSSTNSNLS